MRRITLVSLLLVAAARACAADAVSLRPAPTSWAEPDPAEPVALRGPFSVERDGFYVGAMLGGVSGTDHEADFNTSGVALPSGNSSTIKGLSLAGNGGYLWLSNQIAYGLEIEAEAPEVRGSLAGNVGRTDHSEPFQSSLRGRLGYLFGNVLVYGTAGGSYLYGQWSDKSFSGFNSYRRSQFGWTVGGGLEWGYSRHWSARLEYRYTSYGEATLNPGAAFPGAVEKHDVSESALRAGLIYRFTAF